MTFSLDDVPDQTGKVVVITGASSGIGLECTKMMVSKGAHVVMACRSVAKAQPLADEINDKGPGKATVIRMDTTELGSIDTFAKSLAEVGVESINALILNAGIMMVPHKEIESRSEAHPKMESQMACNVVGHWYLAHVLLPVVRSSPGCRVVWVSSIAADYSKGVDYESFYCGGKYDKVQAYYDSKLGDLLIAAELQRRYKEAGVDARSYGAHPGYSNTALQGRAEQSIILTLWIIFCRPFRMEADGGGKVLALAAGLPDGKLPEQPYFVPNGLGAMSGSPTPTGRLPKPALDEEAAKKLWEACEELCAVKSSI